MRILKSLLGLDKQQAWEQIAADIGGSFHKGDESAIHESAGILF